MKILQSKQAKNNNYDIDLLLLPVKNVSWWFKQDLRVALIQMKSTAIKNLKEKNDLF